MGTDSNLSLLYENLSHDLDSLITHEKNQRQKTKHNTLNTRSEEVDIIEAKGD